MKSSFLNQRPCDGTAEQDSDPTADVNGGCHARLVGCSSFWDSEFAEWNRIIRAKMWNPLHLTRDQMVESLRELLLWVENGNPSGSPQKTGLPSEVNHERIETIRQWIAVWTENRHAPLDEVKISEQIAQASH